MVKVKPTDDGQAGDSKAVRSYIEQNFPGSELQEENYGELHFQVGVFKLILPSETIISTLSRLK